MIIILSKVYLFLQYFCQMHGQKLLTSYLLIFKRYTFQVTCTWAQYTVYLYMYVSRNTWWLIFISNYIDRTQLKIWKQLLITKISTPFLFVCGEADQVFLCIDGKLVTEVTLENSVLVLLCSFYIFNICYPKGCVSTFNFLEFLYFDTCIDKCANSVKQFFTHINTRALYAY